MMFCRGPAGDRRSVPFGDGPGGFVVFPTDHCLWPAMQPAPYRVVPLYPDYAPQWTPLEARCGPPAQAGAPADPALARLMAAVPYPVRASFSPEQTLALGRALQRNAPPSPQIIDYKLSVGIGRGYFIRVLAGRERRHGLRLWSENQFGWWRRAVGDGVAIFLVFICVVMAVAGLIVAATALTGLDAVDLPVHGYGVPDYYGAHGSEGSLAASSSRALAERISRARA
jgi:hypothetical protein